MIHLIDAVQLFEGIIWQHVVNCEETSDHNSALYSLKTACLPQLYSTFHCPFKARQGRVHEYCVMASFWLRHIAQLCPLTADKQHLQRSKVSDSMGGEREDTPLTVVHTLASRSMSPQDSPIAKYMPINVSFSMIHSRNTLGRLCQQQAPNKIALTPYLRTLHQPHRPKHAMEAIPFVALFLLCHILQWAHLVLVAVEGKTLGLKSINKCGMNQKEGYLGSKTLTRLSSAVCMSR